jgi:hypothetical protein
VSKIQPARVVRGEELRRIDEQKERAKRKEPEKAAAEAQRERPGAERKCAAAPVRREEPAARLDSLGTQLAEAFTELTREGDTLRRSGQRLGLSAATTGAVLNTRNAKHRLANAVLAAGKSVTDAMQGSPQPTLVEAVRGQNQNIHRTLWPPQLEPEDELEEAVTHNGEPVFYDGEPVTTSAPGAS